MAYYDYECISCGKQFVTWQTFEEHDRAQSVECPKCHGSQVERLVSEVHVQTSKKS